MLALLTTLHVLAAVVLILIVLVQSARGTDLAGAFGGMGSQTAFGPRGTATFLSKATVALAGFFMVSSLGLSILGNRSAGAGAGSILSDQPTTPPAQTAPAAPTPGAPAGNPPAATPSVQVVSPDGTPMGVKIEVEQPKEPGAPGAQTPAAGTPSATPQTPSQQPAQPAQPPATP